MDINKIIAIVCYTLSSIFCIVGLVAVAANLPYWHFYLFAVSLIILGKLHCK